MISENSISVGLFLIDNSTTDKTEKSMLARWRREYEAYKAKKERRKIVYEAIAEGYDTVSEIIAHTGIPQTSVHRIIVELISKNRITRVKTKNPNYRFELRFETTSIFG